MRLKEGSKMTKENNRLGKLLKQRRRMAELTLHQLSAKSGVSTSYLGRIESGERYPSAAILRKISKPLGISEIELLIAAGFLSPHTPTETESPNSGGMLLDPYVASVLSREPVEIQRTALTIISMLKYMAKSMTI